MTREGIAVVSTACHFPEADSPEMLWSNVVEGRRSFRDIPDRRLPLADYAEAVVGPRDSIPPIMAGLLSDWVFDRARFHVPQAAYETADLSHWLTLQTVAEAMDRIGGISSLPRDRTIVVVANTLTGEFSRAGLMRLRLPYLTRRLSDALMDQGMGQAEIRTALEALTRSVAADFPDPNEESLAGALANTIAGRVSNHFDLQGGAWSVDGACASSLLALSDAATRLSDGSADAAIVVGVDLSLDPFELVGFARTGALATDEMRVFDRRSAGFWPGEGCGVAILARKELAARADLEPTAWIQGWGVSTDGAGGLTRPTVSGQRRALEHAWRRAERAPWEARYFEAHGTGTAVGDPTEISALAETVGPVEQPIAVGSIKANIGHCKAAAGMAGFIKTVQALGQGIIPPHVSCERPHSVFADTGGRIAPAQLGHWSGPRLAGVSGFGFGGVNAHLVIAGGTPPALPAIRPVPVAPKPQGAELFAFSGATQEILLAQVQALRERAPSLSLAEMADAAGWVVEQADPDHPYRAALVASRPAELVAALEALLAEPPEAIGAEPKVGMIFPGQAAPVRPDGGAWLRRFPEQSALLSGLSAWVTPDDPATQAAQPTIIATSLMGLSVLQTVGIQPEMAAGHSVGEVAALVFAEALTSEAAIALATQRGDIMARYGAKHGGMLRVPAGHQEADRLAKLHGLAVACLNGQQDVVLAGDARAISRAAAAFGEGAEPLRVSHAFHSPHMIDAVEPLGVALGAVPFRPPLRPVASTITGRVLEANADLSLLLMDQLTAPVRFTEALELLSRQCDLLIECGPGAGMSRLAQAAGITCLPLDVGAESLSGLLQTLGELWRRGVAMDPAAMMSGRTIRPLDLTVPEFLSNPCGHDGGKPLLQPQIEAPVQAAVATPGDRSGAPHTGDGDSLTVVREVVASETGLPLAAITPEARLLQDMHLNSLSVGRIVNAAAARLGISAPAAGTDAAVLSVEMLAAHLDELAEFASELDSEELRIDGVAPWVAVYRRGYQPFKTASTSAPDTGPEKPWQVFGALPDGVAISHSPEAEDALIILGPTEAHPLSTQAAQLLWDRAKAARAAKVSRITVLHHGTAVEGFLRSLEQEQSFARVGSVDMSLCPEDWGRAIAAAALPGGESLQLLPDGGIARAVLRCDPCQTGGARLSPLGPQDVILVTGGAGGIGAECALRLGQTLGVQLLLAGRSDGTAAPVQQVLDRLKEAQVQASYVQMDCADPASVGAAFDRLKGEGSVPTVLLHAAGGNEPGLFDSLGAEDFRQVLAPKLTGLTALLDQMPASDTRLVIGFGSIIGALGLDGESHYALANDLQSARVEEWGRQQGVPVLALDWSIWAGAGMGERLGVTERLRQKGVDALPLDMALDRFSDLIRGGHGSGRLIVTSRFGPPAHVRFDAPELPLWRFVEAPLLSYPGTELIVEAEVTPGSDPWLEDHVIHGLAVVPGVLLMEAMAQAAEALVGEPLTRFGDVQFRSALSVGPEGLTLRVAAQVDDDGSVRVAIRGSDDGYGADRATARLTRAPESLTAGPDLTVAPMGRRPAAELYDHLWFNAGRFRRIEAIDRLSAFEIHSCLSRGDDPQWFGPYMAQDLRLGDPAARDAGLHMLQACAAQRRVVPRAVRDIVILDPMGPRRTAMAREVRSDDRNFTFDILFCDGEGRAVEIWREADFRAVSDRSTADLPMWMLPTILERAAALRGHGTTVMASVAAGDGPEARRAAMAQLGLSPNPSRGDGKPLCREEVPLTLSRSGGWTLAVAGDGVCGCDLQDCAQAAMAALDRPDQRVARNIMATASLGETHAAGVIWCARETLRKAGRPAGLPLHFVGVAGDGEIELRAGDLCVLALFVANGLCAALALAPGAADAAGAAVPAAQHFGVA